MQPPTKKQNLTFLVISVVMGISIAIMYLIFEWLVNQGTNLIWNTLAQSDIYRWRVIPLAIILGIVYSFGVKRFKKVRLVPINTDIASEIAEQDEKTTGKDILIVLGIGVLSLLAGASLGPEAALVAASIALAAWLSGLIKLSGTPQAKLLTITSLGALLCAFLHTLIPMVIPLLLLLKKKQLRPATALIVVLSCVFSWGVVNLIKGPTGARFPLSEAFDLSSILIAAALGFLTVLIAVAIKRLLAAIYVQAQKIDAKVSWIVSAIVFGGLLGVLYLIGGQSVQFSGEAGVKTLMENQLFYPAGLFLLLLIVKLLATSWSLATGYRGGLVFPSIYMATSLSLAVCTFFALSGSAQTGATIGGASGILIAMTNPIVGVVLIFSLFPIKLVLVMIAGAAGALAGQRTLKRLVQ